MLNGGYNPSILKVPGVQLGALDPCAYFIRMISTWGRVVSYVNGPRNQTLPPWDPNSDFAKFDNELYSMHSSLPQHYIYTRNNLSAAIAENRAHSLIFLHVTIRHSLYFLHRWLFPSKANAQMTSMYKDAPPDFINTSARKCIAAANAISMILADVQEMNTLLLVPFMGFCAFTTATLHVSNAFSPDPEISSTAKRHLATNLKILMVMRKHWYPPSPSQDYNVPNGLQDSNRPMVSSSPRTVRTTTKLCNRPSWKFHTKRYSKCNHIRFFQR